MNSKNYSTLTPQEWRVVKAVSSGRQTKEIADYLCKSSRTVINQIQSIYEKLGIPHNLSSLAIWDICKENNLELPDFIRKTMMSLLLLAHLSSLNNVEHNENNPSRRLRRFRRPTKEYTIISITQTA